MAQGMKLKGDPAITILSLILGKYHVHGDSEQGVGVTVCQEHGLFDAAGRFGYPTPDGRGSDGKYVDEASVAKRQNLIRPGFPKYI